MIAIDAILRKSPVRLLPKQIMWRETTEANLHRWALCRSVNEVVTTLGKWGCSLRGRIAA